MTLVESRLVTGVPVAGPPADVAVENAEEIHRELVKALTNEATGLVIDLTETRYLDSAGIEMLFKLREELAGRRQLLALVVPADAPLRRLLELTAVDKALPVLDDVDAAILAATETPHDEPGGDD